MNPQQKHHHHLRRHHIKHIEVNSDHEFANSGDDGDGVAGSGGDNPLCLCEYVNKHNRRAHLLMCCCNCEALDRLCTSLVCCSDDNDDDDEGDAQVEPRDARSSYQAFIRHHLTLIGDVLVEIDDRLRIPYPGGATKISVDFWIAMLSLIVYVLVGTLNILCSFVAVLVIPTLLYARFFLYRLAPSLHSRKLVTVASSSTMTTTTTSGDKGNNSSNQTLPKRTFRMAHFLVLNTLAALLVFYNTLLSDEMHSSSAQWYTINALISLNIVIHMTLHCSNPGFVTPSTPTRALRAQSSSAAAASGDNYCAKCRLNRDARSTIGHCPICECCVYKRDHHCFWIDKCVGYLNHKLFMFYLISLLVCFCYLLGSVVSHLGSVRCHMSLRFWQSSVIVTSSLLDQVKENGPIESDKKVEANKDEVEAALFSCLFDVYYSSFSRALLSLMVVQLAPLVVYLTILVCQQMLFIGVGLTQHQLYKLSERNVRFSLAHFLATNVQPARFMRNIAYFVCKRRTGGDIRNENNNNNSTNTRGEQFYC